MNRILSLLAFCLIFNLANAQNRIIVKIPTVDQETDYIWNTLQDIKLLEGFNYQISLPEGNTMNKLKEKARQQRLDEDDYVDLSQFVRDSVYNKLNYERGFNRIIEQLALLNALVNRIERANYPWGFKTFKTYTVKLTLFGSGGSYNPADSSIVMLTTREGSFKQYENPANTLIHEIVHLGIEESIIQKFEVEHALKERIVDFFVLFNFNNVLPEYRIQDMGDKRLDPYLSKAEDLMYLDKIVAKILTKE